MLKMIFSAVDIIESDVGTDELEAFDRHDRLEDILCPYSRE